MSTMPNIIPMPDIVDDTTRNIIPMSGIEVITDKNKYCFDAVIVATGGLSYPSTGSTGDGYTFARACGHTITDLKSGLCGLNLEGELFLNLQGVALKNVVF